MSESHNYVVIVAGGSGTRLWPLSRKDLPKQIHKLISDRTLIEETVERVLAIVPSSHIFISTTKNYAKQIHSLLPMVPEENIIVEPISRGTPAAFALLSEFIYREDPEATVLSLASDHSITDVNKFHDAMRQAFGYVNKHPKSIALIGITPLRPDSSLGYIKVDQRLSTRPLVYSVEKFIEKPSQAVAQKYIESHEYYWNAAYYCFRVATLRSAYQEANPLLIEQVGLYLDTGLDEAFEQVPSLTHEIEIINPHAFPIVVLPATIGWSDIGSWNSLHDILIDIEKQHNTVVSKNNLHIDLDSKNTLVMVQDPKKLVATVGLKDIVIVETNDALLVLNKQKSQDIKSAIEILKQRGLEKYL